MMPNIETARLAAQLRTLLTLTNTEIQIATARQSQAGTEAVRDELTRNAGNAADRARDIESALRRLGGVPDVVSPAIGRLAAVATTIAAQAEPLAGALLDDLAVEHQLADRARYLKALATRGDNTEVAALADRLITAHDHTVTWLTTVLAEEALGGPAALRATPLQAVTGAAARVLATPARWSAAGVNRTLHGLRRTPHRVAGTAEDLHHRGTRVAQDTAQTLTAGRDASRATAETLARRDGDSTTANRLHEARATTGALDASELPIADYDTLTAPDAIEAVKGLTEPAQVRAVLGYEEAHKNRQAVVSATQNQLATIAQQVVGIA